MVTFGLSDWTSQSWSFTCTGWMMLVRPCSKSCSRERACCRTSRSLRLASMGSRPVQTRTIWHELNRLDHDVKLMPAQYLKPQSQSFGREIPNTTSDD